MGGMIADIIGLAIKLLNIAADAYMHRNDDHAQVVARFEAAMAEGGTLVDKMKATFAATDASIDAEIAASMAKRA